MDIVPDRDLVDFVDSLGVDKKSELEDGEIPPAEEIEKSVDVWTYIKNALNEWTQRVIDAEARHERSVNIRRTIEDSLYRQQLDGFLAPQDISELRYITDVWIKLLDAVSCYTIGCEFAKRDVITFLLELYSLKQISKTLFIEVCLKL